MHILAIDVGTSSVKAAILDRDSAEPVGPVGRGGYDLAHPTPDAAEVRAEVLWHAVDEAVRAALAPGRSLPTVEGVGLSCLMPALALLGDRDEPLGPFWLHLDRRSRPAARQVQADAGDEFLAEIGNRPLPGGVSALCYRQQLAEDPSLADRVRRWTHVSGWLGLRLTGESALDVANASFTGLFGTMTTRAWSHRWCDYFHVRPEWLPRVVDGAETLGGLLPAVAQAWGLPAGVPVKAGTADTSSAMLAAGMVPGDVLHSVGTTQVLATLTDRPSPDPGRLTRLFGVGPSYVTVTHNPVGGSAFDWLHGLCFSEIPADEFYRRCVAEALKREPTVTLDPPFLGGDRLNIEPARAAFRELTLATDRLDLLAALLDAARRGHRQAFAALGIGERVPGRVFLTGGGADVVRRLLPEYDTVEIHRVEEGALRGVARLF